jgi:ATP-dependent helicase YprA (DUF1998 family)
VTNLRQAISTIESRHSEYIEATYHIRDERLIRERKEILREPGGVSSSIWIEATPPYELGDRLEQLKLPNGVADLFSTLAREKLGLYNPPYKHQASALQAYFSHNRDLVVSTGTGSGKTEIFLSAILGNLAQEGSRGKTVDQRGLRAIILYPMNALVSDQLSRLRRTLGGERSADILKARFGRVAQFGMYTSRTPYHGEYNVNKNDRSVKPIVNYFVSLHDPKNKELLAELEGKGKVPAKDIVGFAGEWKRDTRYYTQAGDRELLTRQEMHSPNEHGGTPDVLITNYSMLEYMLLRPIERPFFDDTRRWLEADKANRLVLVIDEAHLYRGAQGAEVALLLQRLLQRLGVNRDRVRCILTSASLGSRETATKKGAEFAGKLTGSDPSRFEVILGERKKHGAAGTLPKALGVALQSVDKDFDPASLTNVAKHYQWKDPVPTDPDALSAFLAKNLEPTKDFQLFHDYLSEGPRTVNDAAKALFPDLPASEGITATLNFALLATAAKRGPDDPLLPIRLHLFYRGLPRQFACINPTCGKRRATQGSSLLGKIYLSPHLTCPACDSRVFELFTHRTCGAAYLRAFYSRKEVFDTKFLWTEGGTSDLVEVHLLLEEPRGDRDAQTDKGTPLNKQIFPKYLDIQTGYIQEAPPKDPTSAIKVWWPLERDKPSYAAAASVTDDERPTAWSWPRCYACGLMETRWRGQTKVMDLETKGEDPFANIVKSLFEVQPAPRRLTGEMARRLPNQGKKVLCFSDGRQKAARLARDLQRNVERDSFREVVAASAFEAGADAPIEKLFSQLVVLTRRYNLGLFDDGDGPEGGGDYDGSRSIFMNAQIDVDRLKTDYGMQTDEELLATKWERQELDNKRPHQYDQYLLRSLGDKNFSVRAALLGYVEPTSITLKNILSYNPGVEPTLVRNGVLAAIENALRERALDPRIREEDRSLSRSTMGVPEGFSKKKGEGLKLEEILPDRLVDSVGLDADKVQGLKVSLRKGGPKGEDPLFLPANGRFWLNPAAVTLRVDPAQTWKRCKGCGQFSSYEFQGKCPDPDCQGVMQELASDDLYVKTRKDFLRKPALAILEKKRQPFTLRSEEHTAQLTAKDTGQVFGRAERYELLFQDILVGDLEHEQPVDVLSCTTTMEVGIDIGSLTAVALRTVPPRPDNYQQRSGRAGRRASGISLIVTFADNSPHETYVFENPAKMIGADPLPPTVYVENAKIAERHLNATFLQHFFQRPASGDPAQADEDARKWNIFESLGTARAFFLDAGPYSLAAFEAWAATDIFANSGGLADKIAQLVDPSLKARVKPAGGNTWRTDVVKDVCKAFITNLKMLKTKGKWDAATEEEDNLLSTLLGAALLPTFSFPIDLCAFVVRDFDRRRNRVANRYDMTQGLSKALSEYVPGREIVVDKHTFFSYGLYFPIAQDDVNRARSVNWDGLKWLNHCKNCRTVVEDEERNLNAIKEMCAVCKKAPVESIQKYKPEGFAPQVGQTHGAREGGTQDSERVYATLAEFPVPVVPTKPWGDEARVSPVAVVRRLPNQRLIISNYGPSESGFIVCRDCGAVSIDGPLASPHDRPYQIDTWKMKGQKTQCSGQTIQTAFAYDFRTDLAVLSVTARSPLNFAFDTPWFQGAAVSLTQALVLGATRVLQIDTNELAGNWRRVAKYEGDAEGTFGHAEFFLYDTTSGGAGFAADAAKRFAEVLAEAERILAGCDCDTSCHKCLRTYDNRIFHRILNRHHAHRLLQYAKTADIPPVAEAQVAKHLDRVAAALKLCASSLEQLRTSPTQMAVKRNGITVDIDITPVLKQSVQSLTTAAGKRKRVGVTDYEVQALLPQVVGQIVDACR